MSIVFVEKVFYLVPWDFLQWLKYTWNLQQGDNIFLKRTKTVVMKWDFLNLEEFFVKLWGFFLEFIIKHSTTNSVTLKHYQSKEILSIKYINISIWKRLHEGRKKKLQFNYIVISWETSQKQTISVRIFSWKSLLKIQEIIIYTTHTQRPICLNQNKSEAEDR